MNINVSIERLILEGISLPHSQRPLIQAAVEAELARLLAADGLAHHLMEGGTLPAIPGGSIQLASNGNPGTLGQQIAQAVYGGIGGNKR
jgi:hypothetical protein